MWDARLNSGAFHRAIRLAGRPIALSRNYAWVRTAAYYVRGFVVRHPGAAQITVQRYLHTGASVHEYGDGFRIDLQQLRLKTHTAVACSPSVQLQGREEVASADAPYLHGIGSSVFVGVLMFKEKVLNDVACL